MHGGDEHDDVADALREREALQAELAAYKSTELTGPDARDYEVGALLSSLPSLYRPLFWLGACVFLLMAVMKNKRATSPPWWLLVGLALVGVVHFVVQWYKVTKEARVRVALIDAVRTHVVDADGATFSDDAADDAQKMER